MIQLICAAGVAGTLLMPAAKSQPAPLDTRRQTLTRLLAEEWEWEMRESPETATFYGDYRYNDKLSDLAPANIERQRRDSEHFLSRFESIDGTGFPEQEQLNKQLMIRNLKMNIEGDRLKNYEMPEDQFNGIHLLFPQLVSIVPLDTTRHYEDYLARLHQIPRVFDQVIELLKLGEKDGLMPPKFLLEKVVTQCSSIATPAGEDSPFGQPVKKFPDAIPAADQKRLHDAIIAAIDTEVRPAYMKLGNFIRDDYAPKGRTEPGLSSLPDGEARYRYAIRQQTTTDMTPDQIHELGLAQVKQTETEMTAIAQKLGFADLKSFRASLKDNPKFTPTSADQILELYRGYIAQMKPRLPQLFGLLPKADLVVVPVQAYREATASSAEYDPGTPDGSRPGQVYVNTGDFAHRNLLDAEATAYHEGVPGHHMQISIAQELPSLPPFRQHAGYTAYVEGWALYAERLGKEVGFYQDPYSNYGRLSDELLRADRLVLDTGVHSQHWTRQQMVDFFHEHSDESEPDLQAETDRYIAYPAQALAYKLGQLKIIELRERARQQLGNKFDIRAFHDEILNGGALPLDVLDTRTTAWIARQKAAAN